LIAFIVFFMLAYLLAAEFIHSERSKGEVLVFRRGHAPQSMVKPSAQDEESADSSLVGGSEKHNLESAAAGTGTDEEQLRAVIPKQTSMFHWRDVCYEVMIKGKPRQLLNDVDGWVKPGTLTALMVCYNNHSGPLF
jgi:hypothetical protein